ncbi:hypothetical protein DWX68_08660 [Clostridium sp. AF20-7]|jgi:hypothetical protein|uniref:Uncharacterized protein n=1 Tax=Clostridium fessum TaxID=2126740 RepID=A0A2T3FQZ2_9CLOT|nr:hypothetical protein C7U56_07255 [Clostridium fessum]RHO10980.1 hypothetical protein DW227_04535 [Clostridium sp. AM18-55]RHP40268.1 hypothetical protein DWZ45_11190 [Clostridium sp. AF32-7AC]RHQ20424.1 hypothetical protein DW970_04485 [Clostridium sp. AM48-13]RHQ34981.1 hypothetical protein DWY89_03405 [Clostridium sp. AF27-5AA]RHQ67146.1 hypothetical protein DWY27_08540 [Clostridium sp. AF24-2LB]RHQ86603.1 hypothetical protein DWX91_05485 [Clostridium sp. AF22-10]RHR00450.1 hypothetical
MEYLDKVLGVKVTYEDVEFKHGVTVLDAAYLIPFKAKAWMDLTDRKAAGEHVDSKNIKKHNSILRTHSSNRYRRYP